MIRDREEIEFVRLVSMLRAEVDRQLGEQEAASPKQQNERMELMPRQLHQGLANIRTLLQKDKPRAARQKYEELKAVAHTSSGELSGMQRLQFYTDLMTVYRAILAHLPQKNQSAPERRDLDER